MSYSIQQNSRSAGIRFKMANDTPTDKQKTGDKKKIEEKNITLAEEEKQHDTLNALMCENVHFGRVHLHFAFTHTACAVCI